MTKLSKISYDPNNTHTRLVKSDYNTKKSNTYLYFATVVCTVAKYNIENMFCDYSIVMKSKCTR